jgi:transposase-like protein
VIVTDKLRSYGAAHREVMPCVEHRQSKYLNNRAEMTVRFAIWEHITGVAGPTA